jgi:hypothetical protein
MFAAMRRVSSRVCRLVRDERHDRMDKKNDHSRKQGQRHSFIDARAAQHCYEFHMFPHPDDSAPSPDRIVTLCCFGERGVKASAKRGISGSLAILIAILSASFWGDNHSPASELRTV